MMFPSNQGQACHGGTLLNLSAVIPAEGSASNTVAERTPCITVVSGLPHPGALAMFTYAVIFLIISLIAGALGLTNISVVAKRISLILFALFFLMFLAVVGLALLLRPDPAPAPAPASKVWLDTRPIKPA
jgi:uncharacterized membrane protein YtjA (UPF0391 family)